MFQKILQGGSGESGSKVTIIHEENQINDQSRDIKTYCDDWMDLTIDNFYGLITQRFWSYGGEQRESTYSWSYNNTTGILNCTQTSGVADYFKRTTDIVIVR